MRLLTIIYKSGVVVEMSCESYRHSADYLRVFGPYPRPVTTRGDHIRLLDVAEVYEGRIHGAHDIADPIEPESEELQDAEEAADEEPTPRWMADDGGADPNEIDYYPAAG